MSRKLEYGPAVIGFILIILNAIDYIGGFFGFSLEIRTSMITDIIFVMLGMFVANKKNSQRVHSYACQSSLTCWSRLIELYLAITQLIM